VSGADAEDGGEEGGRASGECRTQPSGECRTPFEDEGAIEG
jgi:hypothetical protein